MTYYKVTQAGKSCHGGEHTWSLPTENADGSFTPGDWTPTIPDPVICKCGWHLTTDPMQWPAVGMEVFVAEPDAISNTRDDKIVTNRCRLLRPAPEMVPDWWRAVERFVTEEIPAIPFCQPDGHPDPAWKLISATNVGTPAHDAAWAATRDAARAVSWPAKREQAWYVAGRAAAEAAWDAALNNDATRGAALDAAGDARLLVLAEHVCKGLPLTTQYRDHARARWNVWQKGYCLLGDATGTLIVYAKE